MRRARGKYPHRLVAAQTRRANLQARLVFQRHMEQKQQPDMTDRFQPLNSLTLIERRHQLQHSTCCRGQLWLAGDGEFLLETGAYEADRGDVVTHGADRFSHARAGSDP